jgi:hypothetical protein
MGQIDLKYLTKRKNNLFSFLIQKKTQTCSVGIRCIGECNSSNDSHDELIDGSRRRCTTGRTTIRRDDSRLIGCCRRNLQEARVS